MVLIYTDKITNRVKYIFGLYFRDLLGFSYELTSDREHFNSFEGVKFSYCKNPVGDELFFAADNLLFERKIAHIDLVFIEYNGLPVFFPVYNKKSTMPFDPFAAGFYLVSRYEEYLPYKKDEYGRFSVHESIADQKEFLDKPVINIWVQEIGKILKNRFRDFKYQGSKYSFISTIDIDAAWAYKQKGLFRTLGGYINDLWHLSFERIAERTRVLAGFAKDPFDTYDYIMQINRENELRPIFFILFAEYGFNDKNIPVRNRKFHTLIKSLADRASIGIHPSYNSNSFFGKLKREIERLSRVLNREIAKSRQHFLVLQLPTTYRNLINLDVTEDYSMGFAGKPGFRAGICSTFNFYDLDLDTETHLKVHPFTFMEGTLKDYLKLTPQKSIDIIKKLIGEVKAVNGTFIPIWHNESLSNQHRWKGWRHVYEEMIREAKP